MGMFRSQSKDTTVKHVHTEYSTLQRSAWELPEFTCMFGGTCAPEISNRCLNHTLYPTSPVQQKTHPHEPVVISRHYVCHRLSIHILALLSYQLPVFRTEIMGGAEPNWWLNNSLMQLIQRLQLKLETIFPFTPTTPLLCNESQQRQEGSSRRH